MKIALRELANIQTGVFAKPAADADIVYLQAKHFDENGSLTAELFPDLRKDSVSEKHLLISGDILFAAKGTKNFAAWYENKNLPAVASTSFFVIRIKDNFSQKVLPGYLAWFINHPTSQKFLKRNAIGSAMVSISKAVLEELSISIPDIQTQQAILKITQLLNKENKLIGQIEVLREKQIQQQIINALK